MFTGILQPSHLIILLIVALVFLGPKRIPEAGRALGQGLREFRGSIGGGEDEHHQLASPETAVRASPETVVAAPETAVEHKTQLAADAITPG